MKKIKIVEKIEATTNLKVTPYEHRTYLCEDGDVAAIWECGAKSILIQENGEWVVSKKQLKTLLNG